MIRTIRNRPLLAGLAMAAGVFAIAGGLANPGQAANDGQRTNRPDRGQALAVALDIYTEAVKTGDLDAARQAYEETEEVFDTVKADIAFASPERFLQFEQIYLRSQVPSGLGFFGDAPFDQATNVRLAEEQAATWDEIAAFLAASPQDSALFNDVAVLAGIGQSIRGARTAIDGYPAASPQTPMTSPDPAGAAFHWAVFVVDYPVARTRIAFRNPPLAAELDGLVAAVSAAFAGDPATGFPAASAALAALASRYELGIDLVAAAARNTIPSRPTFDPDAFDSVDILGDIVITLFVIRDLIAVGTPAAAAQVKLEYDDWLAAPLRFKTAGPLTAADAAIGAAVGSYVAAQTGETTSALRDGISVTEQIFVGQYWGTPELVRFYAENF